MSKSKIRHIAIACLAIVSAIFGGGRTLLAAGELQSSDVHLAEPDQVKVERISPEKTSGQGYRLVYHVRLPVGAYRRFKTDFNNGFVTDNKYIRDHRFISQDGDITITENRYSYGPDVFFRWQTTVSRAPFRLDFVLLNPEECQQKYHYGNITIQPEGDGTRVTQTAYFDFWGASFWARYPWKGGMRDFLYYTARWEQDIVQRLGNRYDDKDNQVH